MPHKISILFCLVLLQSLLWSQTTINFDDPAKWTAGSVALGSYAVNHVYADGLFRATGGPALRQTTTAQDGFPGAFGTYAWRLKDEATVDWRMTISSGGVDDFNVKVRRWDSSPSPNYNLEYSIDGGTNWVFVSLIDNASLGNSSAWTTFTGQIESSVNNVLIRIKANGATERIMVDDFTWTSYAAPTPEIVVQSSFVPFYTVALTPSPAQTYTISATHLTENLAISVPQGFEVSTDGGVNYSSSASLIPVQDGSVSATQMSLRLTGAAEGSFSGNVSHSSAGAQTISIPVSGEVSHPTSGYATDLFFSEYVEGNSFRKALEIFNGTGEAVDLAVYSIKKQTNGVGDWGSELTLSGTLPDNDVYVIAYTSGSSGDYIVEDYVDLYTSSYALSFNGNDAVRLYKNGVPIDQIGIENQVADWGKDVTLVRNPDISSPSLVYQLSDWIVYPMDEFYLGSHNFNNNPPGIVAPTVQTTNLQGAPANTSISLNWTPGNGEKRIVVMNTVNSFSAPVNGVDPIANPVYSGAGEQVIYNSATVYIEGEEVNSVYIQGLNPNTVYWFRAYEANGTGSSVVYMTATATGNPVSATTANNQYTGYYTSVSGIGASLKSSLHSLLRTTHTTQYSYDALWTQLKYTDEDPSNNDNIIEIYTGWSVPKSHNGAGTTEWNREHTWSKSHGDFGETRPAGTDLHHMRPCDATVNSSKSNKDFDLGGNLYIDGSPYPGYPSDTGNYTTSTTWEPRDADKGDVARMIMYMAVRYEGTDTSYNLELVDYVDSSPDYEPYYGKLSTLLQWHASDPPDAWEARRNDRIHERQGNRNPFVDHPEYAQMIWTPVPQQAASVSQTSFMATWSVPISATAYYLQVSADSLFGSYLNGYSNLFVGTTTSRTISGLAPGTRYFWRLRSFFVDGYSMYSPLGRVQTTSPEPVATTASIQVSGTNVELAITAVSGASSYKIYASDEPYGEYLEVTSQGTFNSATTWQIPLGDRPRRFYKVMAIR